MSGRLFVVATPIGNLEDITLRGLATLKLADWIACEDTRRTLMLLNHFGIKKPLLTIFGPREKRETDRVIRILSEGKTVALVTDAGTPGLSDPGNYLVNETRRAGFPIEPIPGAAAAAALASVSGVCEDGFIFLGFLPRKKSKIVKELKESAQVGKPIIFFESPFRVIETLKIAEGVMGKEAFCIIGREMTKKFEEFISGTLADVSEKLVTTKILGEFTVLIRPL